MEVVGSYELNANAPRENKLYSKLGWWFGSSQFIGGIGIFLLILGFGYLRDKFGFDIIKMLGPNAGAILVFSAITSLLSGLVLMPPSLKYIRSRLPIMNNMYAAPALALVLGLASTFALKSPSMIAHGQDGKEVQITDVGAMASAVSEKQIVVAPAPPAVPVEDEVVKDEPKPTKTHLRGTIYTAR